MSTLTGTTSSQPSKAKPASTNWMQIRQYIAGALVVLGLVLMVLSGFNIGWAIIGAWLGLLVWKPLHAILVFYSIISVYPVLRVFSVSLRPTKSILSTSLDLIPANASLTAYGTIFTDEKFLLWIWNSLTITVMVSIIGVVVAATGAYAF